jgi:hypothetical protein
MSEIKGMNKKQNKLKESSGKWRVKNEKYLPMGRH